MRPISPKALLLAGSAPLLSNLPLVPMVHDCLLNLWIFSSCLLTPSCTGAYHATLCLCKVWGRRFLGKQSTKYLRLQYTLSKYQNCSKSYIPRELSELSLASSQSPESVDKDVGCYYSKTTAESKGSHKQEYRPDVPVLWLEREELDVGCHYRSRLLSQRGQRPLDANPARHDSRIGCAPLYLLCFVVFGVFISFLLQLEIWGNTPCNLRGRRIS